MLNRELPNPAQRMLPPFLEPIGQESKFPFREATFRQTHALWWPATEQVETVVFFLPGMSLLQIRSTRLTALQVTPDFCISTLLFSPLFIPKMPRGV